MSHHSKLHFITRYISLRGTVVNELYRMMRMGEAGHVMNTVYVNSKISKLSPVTLAGIFKLYRKVLPTLQTRNHEVNHQIFYSARFSLKWQKQLCSWGVQCWTPACYYLVGPLPHHLRRGGWWGFLTNSSSNALQPLDLPQGLTYLITSLISWKICR